MSVTPAWLPSWVPDTHLKGIAAAAWVRTRYRREFTSGCKPLPKNMFGVVGRGLAGMFKGSLEPLPASSHTHTNWKAGHPLW